MSFRINRAAAIAKKEVFHILRDPFTLAMSVGMPVFLVFAFGFVIEFNTKFIPLGVFDNDRSPASRLLIETFDSSKYFLVSGEASPSSAKLAVAQEKNHAALIIPPNFHRDLYANRTAQAQILLDGSDNSTVGPILNYLSSIQLLATKKLIPETPKSVLDIKTRFLFNHELNSQWFVIPGLAVVVMAILSILLTALTVAREWENGSMELLLSTPVKPLEIIIGKLAPYGFMGLMATGFIYVVSRTVFKIPFNGSLSTFMLGTCIFLVTYLAQGLLISVVTRKQQIAMQMAMMSGMIPSQLLSGFIFPIESMPQFFQYFTMLLPARWFMAIARQSYLKGSSLLEMGSAFLALSVLCLIMIRLASSRFKKDLEP